MNQNEQSIKGKFYQNKTYSEKSMPGGGKEKLQSFQLLNLLEKGIAQNLTSFLDKDHPSPEILNQGIISLIKKYQKGDQKLYEQLFILFSYGASPNIPIIYDGIDEINSIKEGENVTLLMFGIKIDDLKLINLVLNFNPEIDKTDFLGRNAIIYAVIFGMSVKLFLNFVLISNEKFLEKGAIISTAISNFAIFLIDTLGASVRQSIKTKSFKKSKCIGH